MSERPNIVVAGGGSGTSVMAGGLAEAMPEAKLTALVTTGDDGGSTGVLREVFGIPAVGDIRRCLSALTPDKELAGLFETRFGQSDDLLQVQRVGTRVLELMRDTGRFNGAWAALAVDLTTEAAETVGELSGHAYGNLALAGLTQWLGSVAEAAQVAGDLLDMRGSVLPVTEDSHTLMLRDGECVVRGEHIIDTHAVADPDAQLWLDPMARIHPGAESAIERADAVLVGPGSVYTSLLPVLAVEGVGKALDQRRGRLIAVANLVTQPHETAGWDIRTYLQKLAAQMGRPFDYLIYNNDPANLSDDVEPLGYDRDALEELSGQVVAIGRPLADDSLAVHSPNDLLAATRGTERHNTAAIASVLRQQILSRQLTHIQ